jgi:hypothetical protein
MEAATYLQKFLGGTGNDLGYGNLNLGTAILYLEYFFATPKDYLTIAASSNPSNDPLAQELMRYVDPADPTKINMSSLSSLAGDIINPNSDTGWAISTLIAKKAVTDFSTLYGDTFTNADTPTQAAYVGTFYKQGEFKILSKFPADAVPILPPPREGDGGNAVMDNWSIVQSILSGGQLNDGPLPDPNAAIQIGSVNGEVITASVGTGSWFVSYDATADQISFGTAGLAKIVG